MDQSLNDIELLKVNEALTDLHRTRMVSHKQPRLPILFIVGLPRSGTTYLTQLLASHTNIGFISNLTARFWQVPALAMALQNSIASSSVSDFSSTFGSTQGLLSPHEFGHFWRRYLPYGECHYVGEKVLQDVDQASLVQEIAAMEATAEAPMMFKNLAACGMHVDFLARILPTAHFLIQHREPGAVARSILRARIAREGGLQHWFSVKPPNTAALQSLPPEGQVFEQIKGIEQHIAQQCQGLAQNRLRHLDYQNLCDQPDATVDAIVNWLDPASDFLNRHERNPNPQSTNHAELCEILSPKMVQATRIWAEERQASPLMQIARPVLHDESTA